MCVCFVFFLKASSEGVYFHFFAVRFSFSLMDREHTESWERKRHSDGRLKRRLAPRLLSRNASMLPVIPGLWNAAARASMYPREIPPGEVWTDLDLWPLHRPRQGQANDPDPPSKTPLLRQVQHPECPATLMPLHGRHLLLSRCQHLIEGVPANGGSVGTNTHTPGKRCQQEEDNDAILQIAAFMLWDEIVHLQENGFS